MPKLFVCGDVLNTVTKESFFSHSMLETINEANYSICNFEAPIETEAKAIKKAGPNKSQNKETIKILKDAGFDLLLLANNHIFDFGEEGLKKTLNEANNNSIDTIGANLSFCATYAPLVKNIDGVKFGFINASEAQFGTLLSDENNSCGYAWINHSLINEMIVSLKKEVDFIVFFIHAGLEHYDVPLIEWKNRYKELCDLGVDCVVASHPHIPQGYESYKGKFIFYSLGNFYFPKHETMNIVDHGYSIILDFNVNKKMTFDIIYYIREGYKIKRISKDESFISFDYLNKKLEKDEYEKEISKIYLEAYDDICYQYYASVFNAITEKDKLVSVLKKIIKQLLFKNRNKESRDLLLLHLTRNETYRYITERALVMKLLKNKK